METMITAEPTPLSNEMPLAPRHPELIPEPEILPTQPIIATESTALASATASAPSSAPSGVSPTVDRPQSIRVAALFFLGQVALSALSLRLSDGYLVPEVMIDSFACLAVSGYIVYKLYQMKPWAVFAYALVQFFGLITLPTIAHMPFLGFLMTMGDIGLAVWVWVTNEDLRKQMDWEFLKKLKL